jgi:hypothetical protein
LNNRLTNLLTTLKKTGISAENPIVFSLLSLVPNNLKVQKFSNLNFVKMLIIDKEL